jgi:hypothetical protein
MTPCGIKGIFFGTNFTLKERVLEEFISYHGHFGFQKTYERTKHSLFWDGMKKDIHTLL